VHVEDVDKEVLGIIKGCELLNKVCKKGSELTPLLDSNSDLEVGIGDSTHLVVEGDISHSPLEHGLQLEYVTMLDDSVEGEKCSDEELGKGTKGGHVLNNPNCPAARRNVWDKFVLSMLVQVFVRD